MSRSASRAFVVKPIPALYRRELARPALTLGSLLLVFAWTQAPYAAPISGNALGTSTGLVDVSDEHAFLAIGSGAAKHAVDGFAKHSLGTRLRSVDQFQIEAFLSAPLGTESGAARLDGGLRPVETVSARFADQGIADCRFADNQLFTFGFAGALTRAAGYFSASRLCPSEYRGEFTESLAAVYAGGINLHVIPSQSNQGEFGGTQSHKVSLVAQSGNTEPSRACSLRVRGAEGVTTRFKGNSEPTSALRHSNDEEIVWTLPSVARGKEAVHKQFGDNTLDSGFDTLNIQAVDVLTAAEFAWKQAAENVAISGLEMRTNSGESRIINFTKAKIKNAMNSFRNNMSADIYSDGTASNQIGGMQALVSDAGTGTVGGINSSTFTFWKSQLQSAASPLQGGGAITASATTIESLMLPLWIKLTRGADMPDLIVMDPIYFAFFEQSQTSLKRYAPEDTGKGGMISMKYKTADVFFDASTLIPASHAYFLNTDYIELVVHKDANMEMMDDLRSINQDAVVTPILWMGNAVVSNRSLQGVIKA